MARYEASLRSVSPASIRATALRAVVVLFATAHGPLWVTPAAAQSPGITPAQPEGSSQSPDRPAASASQARPVGAYAGVTPGTGHAPPRAPAVSSEGRLMMTWPGFQARPDGASRFFVQTNGPVQYESRSEEGRYVLLLKNTRLHLRNNRRPLETRYFNTPVARARVERRGRDLAIVLHLRAAVTPAVTTQQGSSGYHFVLLEFHGGNFLPDELRAQVRPAATTDQAGGYTVVESERPPPVQTGSQ